MREITDKERRQAAAAERDIKQNEDLAAELSGALDQYRSNPESGELRRQLLDRLDAATRRFGGRLPTREMRAAYRTLRTQLRQGGHGGLDASGAIDKLSAWVADPALVRGEAEAKETAPTEPPAEPPGEVKEDKPPAEPVVKSEGSQDDDPEENGGDAEDSPSPTRKRRKS